MSNVDKFGGLNADDRVRYRGNNSRLRDELGNRIGRVTARISTGGLAVSFLNEKTEEYTDIVAHPAGLVRVHDDFLLELAQEAGK